MRYRQYRFKFYLNASHAIVIEGNHGERHPHTWEITINTMKMRDSFVEFNHIEKKIEPFISKYQDQYINEIDPFDHINPTLENCCEYFKNLLKDILNDEGWLLLLIEMSETPTRSYVINLLDESESETQKQSIEASVDSLLDSIVDMDD